VDTLTIFLASVDFMMYRFPQPHHDRAKLKVASGDRDYDFRGEESMFR
jgi:hypothetical protein